MVVIAFSIIVLYSFISFLLVIVGIMYIRIGSDVSVVINILFDGESCKHSLVLLKMGEIIARNMLS